MSTPPSDREMRAPNPEAKFNSPKDLSGNGSMTHQEKLDELHYWREQVQRRLDSANEGMTPEPTMSEVAGRTVDPIQRDAELLRNIELEIEAIEERSG